MAGYLTVEDERKFLSSEELRERQRNYYVRNQKRILADALKRRRKKFFDEFGFEMPTRTSKFTSKPEVEVTI